MNEEQRKIFDREAEEFLGVLGDKTVWSASGKPVERKTRDGDTEFIYEISMCTTRGQDVHQDIYISEEHFLQNLEESPDRGFHFATAFSRGIEDAWNDYDPEEQAALWLDEDGHGKNGAPRKMRDVLKDMEEVKRELERAYKAVDRSYIMHEKNMAKKPTPESMRAEFLETYGALKENGRQNRLHIRPYGHMCTAVYLMRDFEKGDVEKRRAALGKYFESIGVDPEVITPEINESLSDYRICKVEKIVKADYAKMLDERMEKINSVKSAAKSAAHGIDVEKTLEDSEKKKKRPAATVAKDSGREL